jgi:hypothetical protein
MRSPGKLYLLAIVSLAICLSALAGNPSPTPAHQQSFPAVKVASASGTMVNLQDTAPTGKWLLIYVRANSRTSEMMLSKLTADKYGPYLARISIIVGNVEPAALGDFTKNYPDLQAAHWFADPKLDAFQQLNLHGVPVELGLKDKGISWGLSGMLADGASFDSTLLDWLKAN